MTKIEIIKLLGKIIEPDTNKTLEELDAIKSLNILTNKVVDVVIELPSLNNLEDIKRQVATIIKIDLAYPGVKIDITKDLSIKEEVVVLNDSSKIKYLAIASGKGGVGKSSVTANLAYAFKRLGKKVGIIDVDIYGASIPFVLDMKIKPLDLDDEGKIIPANFEGIQIISTEFFVPRDKPLMWRAPIASQMTKMFFESVAFDEETEIVLIDMPPGTGDIAIDVRELLPKSDMIIVTTPNIPASNIAVKAGLGSKEIGHNIIGVIENMSFYYNACSKEKEYIFGTGGAELVAEKIGVDIIGKIPITTITENTILFDMTTIQGKIFMQIAANYLERIKKW